MAAGERRTEVLDSEDEPMTSSPVNVSDSAADKLCADAPVALQDTQDALQDAARTHQANAENDAKSPTHRAGGLEANQENASTNDIAPIDMQPAGEAATSAQGHVGEAHDSEVTPLPSTSSSLQHAQIPDVVSYLGAVTTSTTSDSQQETTQTMTGLDATEVPTDVIHPGPESASHSEERETEHAPNQQPAAVPPVPDQTGITGDSKPEESSPTEIEEEHASTQVADDDDLSQDKTTVGTDELISSGSSALPAVDSTPQDSLMQDVGSKEVTSATKDVTGADHQDAKRETDTQVTGNSTSQLLAQSSVGDNGVEQPIAPTEGPYLIPRRENEDVDVEMTNVHPTEVGTEASNTSPLATSSEQVVPSISTPTDLSEHASLPASYSVTENDVPSLSGSDAPASESIPGAQQGSAQFKTTSPETSEEAGGATDTAATSQASAFVSTTASPDPPTAHAHVTKSPDPDVPAVPKTPQEITLAELRAQKTALLASLATLPAIRILMEEQAAANAEMSDGDDEPTEIDIMKASNKIVKDHIKLLHEYNELKDVGQGLMGLIADQRGVRIVEVQEEFGVDGAD